MRWWRWLFRRRPRPANGEAARRAKREAENAVRDARQRTQEIQREMNLFAAQVEAAMGRRPR